MKYKPPLSKKLFDEEFCLEKLALQKDPLVKLIDIFKNSKIHHRGQ